MPAELSPQVRDFLRQPNPAVMATVGRHGRPLSVATWYLLEEDDLVLLNLDGGRMRLQHLRDDPRVALTVLDGDDWGTHVSLQLDVVRIEEDEDLADIDALARHYSGSPYPNRERPRVSVRAGIRRVHAWGRFA